MTNTTLVDKTRDKISNGAYTFELVAILRAAEWYR